ncbi:TPA: MFS transporter [Staphylococcus aureus]|nr:MFS transporter [Staphylococcus aureus]HDF1781117.1 MFS transporter [Staphylococcus aureus]
MNVEYSKIKKAVPILLFLFVFSLVIDNSFKLISVAIADDLNISVTTVSWQATLAGLVIGIGAVVYASLSDAISIRTLFIYGVILIIIGSIIGYIFQHQFPLLLVGRIIQTAGLAAAETLYVIYVAKYLSKEDQKTYLGLSTSSYSLSLVIGTLSGGFISTYLHWTNMFLIALIVVFTLPFLFKLLPKENNTNKAHLDFVGLILVATIATTVMLFITNFNWLYMIGALIAIIVFALYIKNAQRPLVNKSFFQNKRYASFLFIVFVMYAPLLNEAIKTIDLNMTGVAIGFYNLIINVAVSVGIAIAAALIDFKALNFPGNDALSSHFGIILIILGLMSIVGLVLFVSLNRWTQSEK